MQNYPERYFKNVLFCFMLPRNKFRYSLLVKAQNLQHIKIIHACFSGQWQLYLLSYIICKGENVIAYCLRKYLISSQWICREGEYAYVDWIFHVAVILAPRSEDILLDNLMTYANGDTCGKSKF